MTIKMIIIHSCYGPEEDSPLGWHEGEKGWTNMSDATVFSTDEAADFLLPVDALGWLILPKVPRAGLC